MPLAERDLHVPAAPGHRDLVSHFAAAVAGVLRPGEIPVRFAVTTTDSSGYSCELGVLSKLDEVRIAGLRSIFEFRRRPVENTDQFTTVLIVPTGVGAELGGHAGDAGAVARLLAGACDRLITHPNVVNASDINELPENGLYVEGSVLCRLLMGTAGLQPVRSNRILLVIDRHAEPAFTSAAINSLNAGRACYGLHCARILTLDPPLRLIAQYTRSGRAAGRVRGMRRLLRVLDRFRGDYDALAVSSVIHVPPSYHADYFKSAGSMVNPWGGVEAIFTHAVSLLYDIPSAHSPMLESEEIEELDPGVVDPRMAAEAVSYTFLQSVLKGLHRAPRIVSNWEAIDRPGVISASNVSCLVTPDGCLGLPLLAALEQGIPVVAVRENRNLMRNDLAELPWATGQFHRVENYLEAAGVLCALRSGVALDSVRRPLGRAPITAVHFKQKSLRPADTKRQRRGPDS
jgi:hypothetical protein